MRLPGSLMGQRSIQMRLHGWGLVVHSVLVVLLLRNGMLLSKSGVVHPVLRITKVVPAACSLCVRS